MGRKPQLTNKELKQKYNMWYGNFMIGIDDILNMPCDVQQYLWFCVLQECLYNNESNPILSQMYQREDLFTEEDKEGLSDAQLAPMNKVRLFEGMKTFLMNSGKRKWVDTLHKIQTSSNKGDY
jgi:hypothetical protein